MGTRSTILFSEKYQDSKTKKEVYRKLCCVYQQYDGYLSGVGTEIYEFLSSGELVNGLDGSPGIKFNGIGCLAAQFIAKYKDSSGGLYMNYINDCNEEYNYEIIQVLGEGLNPGEILIKYNNKYYTIEKWGKKLKKEKI